MLKRPKKLDRSKRASEGPLAGPNFFGLLSFTPSELSAFLVFRLMSFLPYEILMEIPPSEFPPYEINLSKFCLMRFRFLTLDPNFV